ncbi:MAG: sugar transferase [Candidatus Nealsonbacteria bacterium]|nr:sugar transferase [Candidatus Nealsonbacteria bacterium]
MLKRSFDFLLSLFGLAIISPLLLAISLWIKIDSFGPVFYRGERVGQFGKKFRIFKFRTMVQNADKMGGPSTASDDPRLTKIGDFLKKYQIDELPQLINVFLGQMSLVGPRPEVPFYADMMIEEEKKIILSVPQGMTDLASLWDFHEGEVLKGSPDPEKAYMEKIRPKKLELQEEYARNHNFFLDLKIIFQTILKIFS